MPRQVQVVPLSEIKLVRVRCPLPECGAVTEWHVDRLANRNSAGTCPACRNIYVESNPEGVGLLLRDFAKAVRELGQGLQVEFVLSVPG